MRMTTYRTRLAVTIGVAALLSASCAPGSDSEEDTSAADTDISTDVPDEEVTLDLSFIDGPEMVDELVAAFSEEYPQVTINTEFTTFADYVRQITLAMTSDTAPDIAQFNPGPMRDLIAEEEIVALDAYADAYEWETKFPPVSLAQLTADETGQVFGTGELYAVPVGLSLTGLFYNKSIAADLGLADPPSTIEELDEQLAAAQEAGVVPLMVGALDSAGIHLWAALINSMMPAQDYRDWVNGAPEGSITTDEALAATDKLVEWAGAGYLNDSANGIGQADATARFAAGDSLFLINGNWAAAQVAQEMGDDAGFILFPGAASDAPARGSGFSVSYSVSSRSDNADVVAAFFDFLGSADAAPIIADGGFLPPNVDAAPDAGGVLGELTEEYRRVVADDGINAFPDFAAPDMLDPLVSGIQSLIADRMAPAEFLDGLQEVRDDFHGQQ